MIDTILNMVWVIGIGLIVVIGIVLVLRLLDNRKANTAEAKKSTAARPRKVSDSEELIPVDRIEDGVVSFTGEKRFVASLNCKGFDLFTADTEEQLRVQNSYLAFINMITNPITLRIDSAAVDLTASIRRHEEASEHIRDELKKCYDDFAKYGRMLADGEGGENERILTEELEHIDKRIGCLERQIKHLEQLNDYQSRLSGRDANPVQEERYILDWVYDPKDDLGGLSDADIRSKAAVELGSRAEQLKHALSRASVKATRDDDTALFELSNRHFHPYSADMYRSAGETNAEDRIVSGLSDFKHAAERYERIRKERVVNSLFEKRSEGPAVTDETEETDKEEEVEEDAGANTDGTQQIRAMADGDDWRDFV